MSKDTGLDDVLFYMGVGAVLTTLFLTLGINGINYATTSQVQETGKLFCGGYGLEYDSHKVTDHIVFTCKNNTAEKIDSIGVFK